MHSRRLVTAALALLSFAPVLAQAQPLSIPLPSATSSPPTQGSRNPSGMAESSAAEATDKATERKKPAAVEEVKPELLYLRDSTGRLVPVPGFQYEDFLELFRLKQQLAAPKPPPFSYQQLTIDGTVRSGGKAAEKTVSLEMRVDVRLNEDGWTRVPLGMGGAVLESSPKYAGKGNHYVEFDRERNEHVAWLRGDSGSEHSLTLKLIAPLTGSASETTLALSTPRAAASRLKLTVPSPDITVTTTPERLTPQVTSGRQSSEINLLGFGEDVRLTWSANNRAAASLPKILEANGSILVNIDGRSVTSEATLSVRSFGAEFDRFHVRIPKGASLAGGEHSGYTLSPVGAANSPMVEVILDEKTVGPAEIKLTVEQAYDVTRPDETIELAGFQVVEAVAHRQSGEIGVVVSGDWQIIWGERSLVRQIDEPSEALRRKDLFAAFEYVGQPCSLVARVVTRKTRTSVEPEYIYMVDANETRLDARLKYSIRGAKVFALEAHFSGWEIDEIGPSSAVDMKSTIIGEDSHCYITLAQPTMGEIELRVRARRSHAANPEALEISLPILHADSIVPATVVLVPADNVELTTDTDQLASLSPQRLPDNLVLPGSLQEPLVFRAERPQARYVGALTVHPQQISVQANGHIHVDRELVRVEQEFDYQVLYEPVDRLSFAIATGLTAATGLEITVDGQRVSPVFASDDRASNEISQVRVAVPRPLHGSVPVKVAFEAPLETLQPDATAMVDLPLLMPLDGELRGNSLTISTSPALKVEVRPGAWTATDSNASAASQIRITAAQAVASVPLSVNLDRQLTSGSVLVERGWIQTWLGENARQERAVFRIASSQPQLAIELPSQVSLDEVEALVDSKPAVVTVLDNNQVAVPWPVETTAQPHVLELRYRYVEPNANGLFHSLELPRFGNSARVRRLYCQLVVPGHQHLIAFDSTLAPEFRWQAVNFGFSRVSRLEQAELEDWVGALDEVPLPESANVYLFSVVGDAESCEVAIARRSSIVFVASSLVLTACLLLLYVPVFRRAPSLIALAAVIATVALAFPEVAVLVGQAAVLGIVLAVIAISLYRSLRKAPVVTDFQGSSASPMVDRSSTQLYYRPATAGSPSSTATTPALLERPAPESQSR